MVEVEVKLPLTGKDDLVDKLIESGFKQGNRVRETDIYFNGIDRDFRKSDEALRIRKTESIDGGAITADHDELANDLSDEEHVLTYKGKKLDNISMSREEIEIKIDDFEGMKTVLVSLGFRPVFPVIKERQYYHSEEMTACLDFVKDLGWFLELEIIVECEDERECALDMIKKQIEELGFSMDDTIRTSYLSMLEAKEK